MRPSVSTKLSERLSPESAPETGQSAGACANGADRTSEFVRRAFEEYNQSLVRYLSARLHSRRDAEEVAQEAYARMLRLDEPDTVSHLQAYLFKIATNIAIDRMRKQGRRPQCLDMGGVADNVAAPASSVDRIVAGRQELALVRRVIADLPPKCRKAFLLYKFYERSYKAIAEDMGLTESMIRKYVLRAVVYCRSRLDADCDSGS